MTKPRFRTTPLSDRPLVIVAMAAFMAAGGLFLVMTWLIARGFFQAYEARLKEREQQLAQQARDHAEKIERLEWIARHGSAELRRRAKEHSDIDDLFEKELLARERPGWTYNHGDSRKDLYRPLNPPVPALEFLYKTRRRFPQAELVYIKLHRPALDGRDEDDRLARYEASRPPWISEDDWLYQYDYDEHTDDTSEWLNPTKDRLEKSVVAQRYVAFAQFRGKEIISKETLTIAVPNKAPTMSSESSDTIASAIRQKVEEHWKPPADVDDASKFTVALTVEMETDGSVSKVCVADVARYNTDPLFRSVADSATMALRRASPFGVLSKHADNYGQWRVMSLTFRPPIET